MRAFWLVLLGLVWPATGWSQAVKDLPRPTDYVSDTAHVLREDVVRQLNLLCGAVDRQAHAQIAVVTVQTTGEEPIQQYAVELEDAWKVGAKGTDRGIILLLAVEDKHRFIETGYGLEGILPDGKVGQIGREMVPALKAGDYNSAVTGAVREMAGVIANDAGVTLQVPQGRGSRPQPVPVQLSLGQVVVGGLVLLLLLWLAARAGLLPFLFGMFLGGGFGGGGGGRDRDGGDGGGSGFSGFGGGSTGGGGAGGDW